MFWMPKESMKENCYVFSGYKQRYGVCLVYLEWKLQHGSNKVGPVDALNLNQKNSRKNACKSKQKTKKVPRNIVRRFAVKRNVRLMFERPNDSMKGKCSVFGSL